MIEIEMAIIAIMGRSNYYMQASYKANNEKLNFKIRY